MQTFAAWFFFDNFVKHASVVVLAQYKVSKYYFHVLLPRDIDRRMIFLFLCKLILRDSTWVRWLIVMLQHDTHVLGAANHETDQNWSCHRLVVWCVMCCLTMLLRTFLWSSYWLGMKYVFSNAAMFVMSECVHFKAWDGWRHFVLSVFMQEFFISVACLDQFLWYNMMYIQSL